MTIPHPKPPAPLSPNGAGQPGSPPSSPVPDGGPGTFDPGSGQVCARLAGPVQTPAAAVQGKGRAAAGHHRQHGTNTRYVWGPDENGTPGRGCRCAACRNARRVAANHRNRMLIYGRWQPYVDAGPAREHIRMLAASGIGWKRTAELAGLSTSTVNKLLYGGHGRPPSRRIRPETEAAILAVQPSVDLLGGSALVAATGTHRRVQALVAIGWSQQKLAVRLGMLPSNFGSMMRRDEVYAATVRAVAALYDELWDQPPPEETHRNRIAANRARNYARNRGWAPPAAWDDDRIEDPGARPADWKRPERLSSAELAEEARELFSQGYSRARAAERLGVSVAALDKALERNREAA